MYKLFTPEATGTRCQKSFTKWELLTVEVIGAWHPKSVMLVKTDAAGIVLGICFRKVGDNVLAYNIHGGEIHAACSQKRPIPAPKWTITVTIINIKFNDHFTIIIIKSQKTCGRSHVVNKTILFLQSLVHIITTVNKLWSVCFWIMNFPTRTALNDFVYITNTELCRALVEICGIRL